jgi:hypothetical protein
MNTVCYGALVFLRTRYFPYSLSARAKFSQVGIDICIEPTNQLVFDVSRWDLARFGSEQLGEIDEELRREIKKRMGRRFRGILNVAKDALIALSALNHDYFITADRRLCASWKAVVEFNEKNKKMLEQNGYKIPNVVRRRKTKGVLQAIISSA